MVMDYDYSNLELKEKLNVINQQLTETVNDIRFYYSEIKFARCIDNEFYAKDCQKCVKALHDNYRYLLEQYNYYLALIYSYTR